MSLLPRGGNRLTLVGAARAASKSSVRVEIAPETVPPFPYLPLSHYHYGDIITVLVKSKPGQASGETIQKDANTALRRPSFRTWDSNKFSTFQFSMFNFGTFLVQSYRVDCLCQRDSVRVI